jgi:phosphomannomutase
MLAVLRLLSKDDKPLSAVVKPIENRFRSGEINLQVEDKPAAIARVKSYFIEQGAAADEYDGLTIELPDRWFNIRASNTEPLLRVNVEGDTQDAMEALRDDVLRIIGA